MANSKFVAHLAFSPLPSSLSHCSYFLPLTVSHFQQLAQMHFGQLRAGNWPKNEGWQNGGSMDEWVNPLRMIPMWKDVGIVARRRRRWTRMKWKNSRTMRRQIWMRCKILWIMPKMEFIFTSPPFDCQFRQFFHSIVVGLLQGRMNFGNAMHSHNKCMHPHLVHNNLLLRRWWVPKYIPHRIVDFDHQKMDLWPNPSRRIGHRSHLPLCSASLLDCTKRRLNFGG